MKQSQVQKAAADQRCCTWCSLWGRGPQKLSPKICNRNGATVSEAVSQLKFQQMTFPANGTHNQGSKLHTLSSSMPLVARGTPGTAFHRISHVPFQGTWLQPWVGLTKKKLVGSWSAQYQQEHKLLDHSTDSHPQVVKTTERAMPKEHRSPVQQHPTWAGSNGPRAG